MRFLIVDDETNKRRLIELSLDEMGYTVGRGDQVDHATNGDECRVQVAATPPVDVIFMDGGLGDSRETGPMIVRSLRKDGCAARIIMMSADSTLNQQGVKAGANDCRTLLESPMDSMRRLFPAFGIPLPSP